jgi:ribosomal protein uL24
MASTLDKPLREKYSRRSIEVRTGDEVKVMRGKFSKKLGKVGIVDVKHTRIQIDGLQRAKKGGEKLETWFNPSNVKIVGLYEDDSRRMKNLKKKSLSKEKIEVKKKEEETKEIIKENVRDNSLKNPKISRTK